MSPSRYQPLVQHPSTFVPTVDDIYELLNGVPLFSRIYNQLDDANQEREKFLASFQHRVYRPGEAVFFQGDVGHEFFIVFSGEAVVWAHEENYLRIGDRVRNAKDVHFGGRKVPVGTEAIVDKFDPNREYNFSVHERERFSTFVKS